MNAQLGWPYVAGMTLAIFLAGDTLRSISVRPRLFAALPLIERLFAVGALGFLLLSWWGVVLAEVGAFRPGVQLMLPALVVFLVLPGRLFGQHGARHRSAWRLRGGRLIDPRWIAAVLLVIVGATFYLPTFDVRFEARDPGVYYLSGVELARGGSLQWSDELLATMPEAEREAWYPTPGDGAIDRHRRYLGFYLDFTDGGASSLVKPQAMPVFPVWIAAGELAFGTSGAMAAGAVFAVLGAFAWMIFVGRWLSPLAGAFVGVAIGANFVQSWFARYSAAEMPAQLLVAIGLYGLVTYRRHGDALFGLLAAGGLGLALLTKAELLLLAGPLALLLLHDVARGGIVVRDWLRFWIPLGVLMVHTAVHGRLLLWPYFHNLMQQATLPPEWFVPGAAGCAVAVVLLLVVVDRIGRARRAVDGIDRALGIAAATAVVPFAAWGLWFRPSAGHWDAANFLHLLWAVSPVVLALAIGGVVWTGLRRRPPRWRDAILALLVAVIAVGLMRRQIIPALPWAYRRWLPMVLPGTFALGGVGAVTLAMWIRQRLPYRALLGVAAALAIAAILPHQVERLRLYDEHRELPGSELAMQRWRELLGPQALVVFEPRTLRGLERFEAALAIEAGYDVLRLPEPEFDASLVLNAVRRAARVGKPAFLVTTGYLNGLAYPRAEPVDRFVFESQRLFEPYVRLIGFGDYGVKLPERVQSFRIEASVYRLLPGGTLQPLGGELDIGEWDELYLRGEGFHSPEVTPDGRGFRWTTASAAVLLPGMDGTTDTVIVRAEAAPPGVHADGQRLTVFLDDIQLGETVMRHGWSDYRFPLPQGWAPPADRPAWLRIETDGFRPIDTIPGSQDRRNLGLALDKVGWQPVGPAIER